MKNAKRTILMWAPFAFSAAFGILAVSLHHVACPKVIPSVYIQAPLYALVPVLFPLLEKFAKIRLPGFLVAVITLQIIISVDLGTALNFYAFIPHYDKILHTFFGFWCAPLVMYFISLWGGDAMNAWGKGVIVLLAVLGAAAVWEVSEYCMSLVLGTDPQLWKGVLSDPSYHPLKDTMWDIIVAAAGTGVFFVTLGVDRLCGGKLWRGVLAARPAAKDRGHEPGETSSVS